MRLEQVAIHTQGLRRCIDHFPGADKCTYRAIPVNYSVTDYMPIIPAPKCNKYLI